MLLSGCLCYCIFKPIRWERREGGGRGRESRLTGICSREPWRLYRYISQFKGPYSHSTHSSAWSDLIRKEACLKMRSWSFLWATAIITQSYLDSLYVWNAWLCPILVTHSFSESLTSPCQRVQQIRTLLPVSHSHCSETFVLQSCLSVNKGGWAQNMLSALADKFKKCVVNAPRIPLSLLFAGN